jgi:glycosyltransferase-like protein
LKIALLTYSTKPRGSVVHTLELAQALLELGHSPHVFALDKSGEGFHRAVDFQTFAVPASECKGNTDVLVKQRIAEFVSFFEQHAEKYDVYHAQDCLSANALSVLKERGYLTKFVRTVHHIEDFKSPYLQDCQQKSIFNSDRCLCVSDLWQKELETKYGIFAHRVVNGVSKRFSPRGTSNKNNGPLYMTVGGIEPRKNSINLLKAFAIAHQTHLTAQLMIVGGATLFDYQDYRDEFMALVNQYDLADSLILPGVVSDQQLAQLYRQADAFVFPSVKEGWGLVVLEAIASGLPVVTSNQAPFTEFLSEDSAILVDPADVDAIAAAMLKIIRPEVAARLNAQAVAILDHYSWQRSAKLHLDLYFEMCAA